MGKKAVDEKPARKADWQRGIDPLSSVSPSFPTMHSRYGSHYPEAFRPTRADLLAAEAEQELTDEQRREIEAEMDSLLTDALAKDLKR